MGKKYQFRVVAVTKAGESDPSQETKPHLCRYKNLSPCIDQGSGGSKMVKLNRMATFQIKVRGEPRATFSWLKEGQKLREARPGSTAICTKIHARAAFSVLPTSWRG